MKKLREVTDHDLRPVLLTLADVREIVDRWARDAKFLRIECQGYGYDSLDELLTHVTDDYVAALGVQADHGSPSGSAYLTIHRNRVSIITGPEDEERAAYLAAFLKTKQRWGGSSKIYLNPNVKNFWQTNGYDMAKEAVKLLVTLAIGYFLGRRA